MSLFIAIPSREWTEPRLGVLPTPTQAMLGWLAPNENARVDVVPGCCWVDYARALLLGRFYASECDELLWVDDDVSWEDRSLVRRMRSARLELVTCAYATRKIGNPMSIVPLEEARPYSVHGQTMINVRSNGLGCTLIKRSLIETLWKDTTVQAIADDGTEMRMLFNPGIRYVGNVPRHRGDDDSFFDRLYDLGIWAPCMVDAELTHAGVRTNLALHPWVSKALSEGRSLA